ncbi:CHAT domain-containing protein [Herbidospora galbida]|uniref:CHAT domain-containing protein n=1 Tax=Herbidospora galbida TaxID=2575442 RepID=A0A4U3MK15_9ACTN|nr:CHAT domain-containing tetratricopeptide repeat protein [Herbidospora galbida]TKK88357.1 CHAT domain-containing protein [Herbidospora galbida]
MNSFFDDPDVFSEQAIEFAHAFEQIGDIRLQEKAIELFRMAVSAAPPGNPDRGMYLSNLANGLINFFERTGDLAALREALRVGLEAVDVEPLEGTNSSIVSNALGLLHGTDGEPKTLDEAVAFGRRAIELTPADDDHLPTRLSNLAALLQQRYLGTGDTASVAEGIEAGRAAHALVGKGHYSWQAIVGNLGVLLRHRYEIDDDPADLQEALDLVGTAVSTTPRGHVDRALYLGNLATVFGLRYERDGRQADLDEAFKLCREALDLTPKGHPGEAGCLSVYGNLLRLGVERTGAAEELDEAVDLLREAARTGPERITTRALNLATLSLCLRLRYEQFGRIGDLTEAMETVQAALALTSPGDPERPARIAGLGVMKRLMYERTSRTEVLKEAIGIGREALAITPPGHRWYVGFLNSLSNALRALHQVTGDGDFLTEAITLNRTAAATVRPGSPDHAVILNGLANALLTSFARTNDLNELNEAIALTTMAITGIPEDHLSQLLYVNNLGNLLRIRHERTGDEEDLAHALRIARTAVDITPRDHAMRSSALSNLGVALMATYLLTGDLETWAEAVATGRDALALTPSGHHDQIGLQCNLAQVLRARFEKEGRGLDELREAIGLLIEAARSDSDPPSRILLAQRLLAQSLMLAGDGEPALAAYRKAIELLPRVTTLELTRSDRRHGLAAMPGLAGEAAAAAIAAGLPDLAVELLEQARGLLLSEVMIGQGELAPLDAHAPAGLVGRFQRVRQDLDEIEAAAVTMFATDDPAHALSAASRAAAQDLAERRRGFAREWDDTVAEIRAIPALRGFLRPPSIRELGRNAAEGPIVLVNTSRFRCDALILTDDPDRPVILVELPALAHQTVIDQVNRFRAAIKGEGLAAQKEMLAVLGWLWDAVAGPVMTELGLLPAADNWPRLWWCPVGETAFLPLHAAGRHQVGSDATVLDRVISSYTPTIRALRHARERAAAAPGPALLIAQPKTPFAEPLPGTLTEVRKVAGMVPGSRILIGEDATCEVVLNALPAHPVIHLACHGHSDWNDPGRSRLLLHDHTSSPFSVAAIASLRLAGAELAYLSACNTTVANQRLVDEAVHITTAFQLAGFRHVIGTLWPVGDTYATSMALSVYGDLTRQGATPPDPALAASALHHAVRARRDEARRYPGVWASHIHAGA